MPTASSPAPRWHLTGLLHLVRLARWAGDRTGASDCLLILHVGYAFVPLGFLLNAASAFGLVPPGAGVHAWMAGAAGIMTLAVMSRATLGHTGQRLTASGSHAGDLCRDHRGGPGADLRCDRAGALRMRCCMSPHSPGQRPSLVTQSAFGRLLTSRN